MQRNDMTRTNERTEKIWRNLSDRLRQFIRSRVNSIADADDLLQDVFLRIHQSIDNLQTLERLESWAFQIARNVIADYFRNSGKNAVVKSINSYEPATTALPNEETLNRRIAKCLASFVNELPLEQRRAITRYEFDGVSQQEIANEELLSISGAKSRIQRGRQQLKEMMTNCCDLEFDRRGNITSCDSKQSGC